MKLLLCSDFKNVGYKYLNNFFDLTKSHTCLFINYASEDFNLDEEIVYTSSSMQKLQSLGFQVNELKEDYSFNEHIDMIFVRGGNTTKLIYLLRLYNQFDKIKQLVEKGTVYVGESAGSVLAGSDTEWTLRSEPFEVDVKKEFGDRALLGFGFVNKMVFVHCSKYRFPFSGEVEEGKIVRLPNTEFYLDYLKDRKLFSKDTYLTLGNNQVYFQNDNIIKILTYDWSKIETIKK